MCSGAVASLFPALEAELELHVRPGGPLRGRATLPGDKSIAHRALILAALAEGPSEIRGYDPLDDCQRTLEALRACGVAIEPGGPRKLRVAGCGRQGLRAPAGPLNCGLSGTTMRLLAGALAGQPIAATLDGDPPLRRRPMARVTEPLTAMGARIDADGGGHAPLTIRGGNLRGIDYALPVASAQVKSALLLAGLNAEGETVLREPAPTRDHTERMLRRLGVEVEAREGALRLVGGASWAGFEIGLPGDISGAAFLLAAAALVPGSEVTLTGVGVNPSRNAVLDVLARMGAPVAVLDRRGARGEEPVADLGVRPAALRGLEIRGALIPNLIDELPILAVAATQAQGTTVIADAAELRLKETDRIAALARELSAMGAQVEPTGDGLVIEGPAGLHGARVDAHGDHRLAMALAVAGLVAAGETVIEGAESVSKSFPGFVATMQALGANME